MLEKLSRAKYLIEIYFDRESKEGGTILMCEDLRGKFTGKIA
jgi:hypothetical protein